MIKECKICHILKEYSEFYLRKKNELTSIRGECKSCADQRIKNYRKTPVGSFKKYKLEAKRRNIEFKLSYKDFIIFKDYPCYYCGTSTSIISLDRIDNSTGYSLNNVVSCCSTCNYFKFKFTENEFLTHVRKIFLYQQEKGHE